MKKFSKKKFDRSLNSTKSGSISFNGSTPQSSAKKNFNNGFKFKSTKNKPRHPQPTPNNNNKNSFQQTPKPSKALDCLSGYGYVDSPLPNKFGSKKHRKSLPAMALNLPTSSEEVLQDPSGCCGFGSNVKTTPAETKIPIVEPVVKDDCGNKEDLLLVESDSDESDDISEEEQPVNMDEADFFDGIQENAENVSAEHENDSDKEDFEEEDVLDQDDSNVLDQDDVSEQEGGDLDDESDSHDEVDPHYPQPKDDDGPGPSIFPNQMSDLMKNQNELLRKRLQSMPLAKVNELKNKLGIKLFNKTFFGAPEMEFNDNISNSQQKFANKKKKQAEPAKKKNPKRPREMSSKKPIGKFRQIVPTKKVRLDPRFDANCGGDFDDIQFRKDYGFISEIKKQEIGELKKAYKTTKRVDPQKAERIKLNLLRLENQQKSAQNTKLMQDLRAELRQENIARMKQGQKPIYINNEEMKKRFKERKLSRNEKK